MKFVYTYNEFLNTVNESKVSGYIEDCLEMIHDLNVKFSENSSKMSSDEIKSFYNNMGKLTDKLNTLRAEKGKIDKSIEKAQSDISLLNSKRSYYANFISNNIASLKNSQYNHDGRLKDNEGFYQGLLKVDKEIKTLMDKMVELSNEVNKY
jgi:uncharacterized coiled-coil DUF342 family protein